MESDFYVELWNRTFTSNYGIGTFTSNYANEIEISIGYIQKKKRTHMEEQKELQYLSCCGPLLILRLVRTYLAEKKKMGYRYVAKSSML
jgi:hypothetical protein